MFAYSTFTWSAWYCAEFKDWATPLASSTTWATKASIAVLRTTLSVVDAAIAAESAAATLCISATIDVTTTATDLAESTEYEAPAAELATDDTAVDDAVEEATELAWLADDATEDVATDEVALVSDATERVSPVRASLDCNASDCALKEADVSPLASAELVCALDDASDAEEATISDVASLDAGVAERTTTLSEFGALPCSDVSTVCEWSTSWSSAWAVPPAKNAPIKERVAILAKTHFFPSLYILYRSRRSNMFFCRFIFIKLIPQFSVANLAT